MTCKIKFEFSLGRLPVPGRNMETRHADLVCGLPPFSSTSVSITHSKGLCPHAWAFQAAHPRSFYTKIKSLSLPPLRLRGAHTSCIIVPQWGQMKKRHEQVLETSSRLLGQGMLDSPSLERVWEALWPHRFLVPGSSLKWGFKEEATFI